jgi:hypothetical protein
MPTNWDEMFGKKKEVRIKRKGRSRSLGRRPWQRKQSKKM